jgi:hypothetical protein
MAKNGPWEYLFNTSRLKKDMSANVENNNPRSDRLNTAYHMNPPD